MAPLHPDDVIGAWSGRTFRQFIISLGNPPDPSIFGRHAMARIRALSHERSEEEVGEGIIRASPELVGYRYLKGKAAEDYYRSQTEVGPNGKLRVIGRSRMLEISGPGNPPPQTQIGGPQTQQANPPAQNLVATRPEASVPVTSTMAGMSITGTRTASAPTSINQGQGMYPIFNQPQMRQPNPEGSSTRPIIPPPSSGTMARAAGSSTQLPSIAHFVQGVERMGSIESLRQTIPRPSSPLQRPPSSHSRPSSPSGRGHSTQEAGANPNISSVGRRTMTISHILSSSGSRPPSPARGRAPSPGPNDRGAHESGSNVPPSQAAPGKERGKETSSYPPAESSTRAGPSNASAASRSRESTTPEEITKSQKKQKTGK